MRLDVWVAKHHDISRSLANRLTTDGNVLVNKERKTPSYRIQSTDTVTVTLPTKIQSEYDLAIIEENDYFIAISKPQGLLVHAKDNQDAEQTVQSLLASKVDPTTPRGGIVHRLDRDTSGVMVVARTLESYEELKSLFKQRHISKTYIAIVDGSVKDDEAIIKWPIARWPKKPALFRVDANGKSTETKFKVTQRLEGTTVVELYPKTGRTHQLRVHMAHLGNPIAGDHFYNKAYKEGQKLMLHAQKLDFKLQGKQYSLESPTPKRFSI